MLICYIDIFKWLITNSCLADSGKRQTIGCWSWQKFRTWWLLHTSFIYRTNSAGKADFRPCGKTVDKMFLIFENIIQIEIWLTLFSLQGPSEDLKTKLSLHEDVLSPRLPTTPLSKSLTINKKGVCQAVYSKRYLYFSVSHCERRWKYWRQNTKIPWTCWVVIRIVLSLKFYLHIPWSIKLTATCGNMVTFWKPKGAANHAQV